MSRVSEDRDVLQPELSDTRPVYVLSVTYPVTEVVHVRAADALAALAKAHDLTDPTIEPLATYVIEGSVTPKERT